MKDIPSFGTFRRIKPIAKGLSNDKKFYIETFDGKRMLLRITDVKAFNRKEAEFRMMERVHALGVLAPEPYELGLCNGGKSVYSLSGWLAGKTAEEALPYMNEREQYGIGVKAGLVLRKIHTLPAPDDAEPWETRFQKKVQTRIDLYNKHGLQSKQGERIVQYLREKRDIVKNRPQTFWHGDFNIGNQMLMPGGVIGVIDFNAWNLGYGDPCWEFVVIPWGEEPQANYFTGLINGYFNDNPPGGFFELLSYYFACDALSALCYTFLGLERDPPEAGRRHMANILRWFDNMKSPTPIWYNTSLAKGDAGV